MKIISNKNVELQDTIDSLGKAAGNGGANFISSLLELKNMQDNFSHLQIELETRFAQELPRFGSKHGEKRYILLYSDPPRPVCFFQSINV
jgi:hypothetical protein